MSECELWFVIVCSDHLKCHSRLRHFLLSALRCFKTIHDVEAVYTLSICGIWNPSREKIPWNTHTSSLSLSPFLSPAFFPSSCLPLLAIFFSRCTSSRTLNSALDAVLIPVKFYAYVLVWCENSSTLDYILWSSILREHVLHGIGAISHLCSSAPIFWH